MVKTAGTNTPNKVNGHTNTRVKKLIIILEIKLKTNKMLPVIKH